MKMTSDTSCQTIIEDAKIEHWTRTLPTRERLLKLKQFFTDNKVTEETIRKEFLWSPSECKYFNHEINDVVWEGFIYLKRNSMMGSIFSYYDGKPFFVRGYPKIRYAEDSVCMNKESHAEEKIDGTNLVFWTFPDGNLMAKTRMVERADRQGYQGNNWMKMTHETDLLPEIQELCNMGYQVVGELYGTDNPGEYIPYSESIAFTCFEICNTTTFEWVALDKKTKLLHHTNIPQAIVEWMGVLDSAQILQLEKIAGEKMVKDGIEGYIIKYYDEDKKDSFFAKVKTEKIKEIAWRIAANSAQVPRQFISKAVKKAWDNQTMFSTTEDIINFVKDELLEEFDEERVGKSGNRIKKLVGLKFTPPEKVTELGVFFDELVAKGIDIENKGKVLSMGAKKFIGLRPGDLYQAWQIYVMEYLSSSTSKNVPDLGTENVPNLSTTKEEEDAIQ